VRLEPPVFARKLRKRWQDGKEAMGPLLIGLLDDGCPFAASQFSMASGTRVRGIWDQDRPDPINMDDSSGIRVFGEPVGDFGYGVEFLRDFAASTQQIGLDEWIKLHSTSAVVDEDGCYSDARFGTLKHRESHGAHVMDVLAGRIPPSSRVGPLLERRDPPSFAPATDDASEADLVFVQFPQSGIRDGTGVWLKNYVVNGIQYILSFAEPDKTKNVIVNLSYGPTTGPHDGTAVLEEALKALTTEYDGSPGKPKLEIILPSGNAYLSDGHVAFVRRTDQPDYVEWTWCLPPDNTVLCFAEVWTKKTNASGVVVTLTSPSGYSFTSTTGPTPPPPGSDIPPYTGVFAPLPWGDDTMWLLAVEPTVARSAVSPEHGNWTIRVEGIGEKVEVHAYVARSDPNMGARTGAKLSRFVDPKWERARGAAAACTFAHGMFDRRGSLIDRNGTLNGIATADVPSIRVAGGYIIANGRKSPYSSAGPVRLSLPARRGPDFALPSDESCSLQGIRAGGNRSGGIFRLIGTSVAAPQLARYVANAVTPTPFNTLNPEEETGEGDVAPP
jgi:hypothetical protein